MIPGRILYTDGHGVTVTDSTLKVRNHAYILKGITRHGLYIIHPQKMTGILLLLSGIILMVFGIMNAISPYTVKDIEVYNQFISANMIARYLGAFLTVLGIVLMALLKEKYALRIATAEGEKNAVVSDKKEYIAQIESALNDAFVSGKYKHSF